MISMNITISDVHRIKRPRVGYIYQGRISAEDLYVALRDGTIQYAPKYQRGFKASAHVDDVAYEKTYSIEDERLDIQLARAQAMAAKYLMALNGAGEQALYAPDVTWNARREPSKPDPEYDSEKRELTIHGKLTIPDSGHRHFAYYLLVTWKKDPSTIPDEVVIGEDGETVSTDKLLKWIEQFDPSDEEESSILVQVFSIDKEMEGRLFDEYNVEGKKPSTAASIDMYPDKTAHRRFVENLMETCDIFGRTEIENRRNTISAKSRKLTTNATLVAAARPYARRLLDLEKQKDTYTDLVSFFDSFYEEWARHYKEFEPFASGEARQALRKRSFALSNIMFFPMFRLAFELWEKYRQQKIDWRSENEWKDVLARLAGKVEVDIEGEKMTVPVMARDAEGDNEVPPSTGNPDWHGKILLQNFDPQGNSKGWGLSSTRQTRDTAFHYLVEVAGVNLEKKGVKAAA